jgi:hypothetical protein
MKGRSAYRPSPPEVITNNTNLPIEEVRTLQRYGGFLNRWRNRYVDVYQPSVEFLQNHPETVITVGHNSESNATWICVEPASVYSHQIAHADWQDSY